jgi:hypothetical protein
MAFVNVFYADGKIKSQKGVTKSITKSIIEKKHFGKSPDLCGEMTAEVVP